MLGASRTTMGSATSEFEQLRLKAEGDRIVYVAAPSGQKETSFSSITIADTLMVFENTAHDFPQRIIYRRRGADSIIARIEGMRGGRLSGVDYPFRRVAC